MKNDKKKELIDKNNLRTIRTACSQHCGIDACGILAHVKGDRVVKLEPADFPNKIDNRICLRGLSMLDVTYHPDRLKYPMKRVGERGEGKFERISWDEALDTIAGNLKNITSQCNTDACGRGERTYLRIQPVRHRRPLRAY